MKIFALTFLIALVGITTFIGCDQGRQMMKPVMDDLAVPEPPMVTEVSYYRNWQLSQQLTKADSIQAETTIYAKVVFSEPMQLVVSDNKDARPVLSFVIDGKATRYRVKPHGTSGKDFQSGDCKPTENTHTFLCRYTVQAGDRGMFSVRVGKASTDKGGAALADVYTSGTSLSLEPPEPNLEPPSEIDYYQVVDRGLLRIQQKIDEIVAENPEDDPFRNPDFPFNLYREEFGIEYDSGIATFVTGLYEEFYLIATGGQEKKAGPEIEREYIKLAVEFPDKNRSEIFEIFIERIREMIADEVLP